MDASIDTTEEVIRVSGSSSATNLGQAIAHAIYEHKTPKLRAIGAGAVNQAIKACAIARGYVAVKGKNLSLIPGFESIPIGDEKISAVTLQIVIE